MKHGKSQLAAIMFTDMVGYSALVRRDETLGLRLMERQRRLLRPLFAKFGGREINAMGDGFLIEFSSAIAAVQCATTVQEVIAEHNRSRSSQESIQLRIGVHVGEVIRRGTDVVGDDVNIAARLERVAFPGGVCVSQHVFDQVSHRLALRFEPIGAVHLKSLKTSIHAYHIRSNVTLAAPAHVKATTRSIAVLPFVNISASSRDDYLADGITEELINSLCRAPSIRVVSRTSVFAFKGKCEDVRSIGANLNVEYIVEGSIRRERHSIQVATRLVNAYNGFQLWTETFACRVNDVYRIRTEVTSNILRLLGNSHSGESLFQPPSRSGPAYHLYLKGRFEWNKRTPAGLQSARRFYQRAVSIDPRCALAHAGIADCYALQEFYGGKTVHGSLKRALASAKQAVKLGGGLSATHTSLAYALLHDWKFYESGREFREALTLDPEYVQGRLWYGIFHTVLDNRKQAIQEAHQAVTLDRMSAATNAVAGMILYFAREYRGAHKLFTRALELDNAFALAHEGLGHLAVQRRAWDEALSRYARVAGLPAIGETQQGAIAYTYGRGGQITKARAMLCELKRAKVSPVAMAIVHLGLGEPALALDALWQAYQQRSGRLIYLLANPLFDELRDDLRFARLTEKVGLLKTLRE
jgi:TolB-like protein